jgi:hypothetical protein
MTTRVKNLSGKEPFFSSSCPNRNFIFSFGLCLCILTKKTYRYLRMQENIERIVLCDAVVFHKTQMAYVLTPSILQHIQDLSNKLKQPDPTIASLLVALVFLQGTAFGSYFFRTKKMPFWLIEIKINFFNIYNI